MIFVSEQVRLFFKTNRNDKIAMTMQPIPHDLKCTLYWFVDSISKGLFQHPSWDFDPVEDFDNERISWNQYLATITDPTIIKTAYTIWMNNICMNSDGIVHNGDHAAFRAFQYLRPHFDDRYSWDEMDPPLTDDELTEPQW